MNARSRSARVGALATVALLVGLAACSSSKPHEAAATFAAHGSAEQIWVVGGTPGATMTVTDGHDKKVASEQVDQKGSALFRDLTPGSGFEVHQDAKGNRSVSPAITVLSNQPAPPDTAVYDQTLPAGGYGYLTTRDGTKLAIDVRLPGPVDKGPYPTLIEYSGYDEANPAGSSTSLWQLYTLVFHYAVVDINMRGTGCSGGVFDFFEPLQALDGYDAVETVARQPWVLNHKVALAGISYPAISQLFVGATDPPDLAAIAPLSVIDAVQTTLYPGGIYNVGFANSWAEERVHDSKEGGQPWSAQKIKEGDQTCIQNQALRLQTPDLLAKIQKNSYYDPSVADPLAPITFVNKIKMPVFLACQWEDEQTGGHCADLADKFTGTQHKWFTFTNGLHIDSIDPATLNRYYDFFELYLAQRKPTNVDAIHSLAPVIYKTAMGISGVTMPTDPIQQEPTYQAALDAFNSQPQVRILFDNGAGAAPGQPTPGFEANFPSWPIPGTTAQALYLGPNGTLTSTKPTDQGANSFHWDPTARPASDFSGGDDDVWQALPAYKWVQPPTGDYLSYVSEPLTQNTVVIGAGAVTVWLKSSEPDTDLQVTVSEVRPDGKETFVQNGWLRASFRKLDPAKSTPLAPVPSGTRADVAPLPAGQWTKVTIPLYYEGHAYRAGSRIRIAIEAPGGTQPAWAFQTLATGGRNVTNQVAFGPDMPSELLLPVVPGVAVPTPLPACPALRGEPCRTYQPAASSPAT